MGTEIEVKLAASQKMLERIENIDEILNWNVKRNGTIHLVSHYFDTPGFNLLYNNFAYRLREENENRVATLKANGKKRNGIYIREEINKALLNGEDVSSKYFIKKHFPQVLEVAKGKPLDEVLMVNNNRHILHITRNNSFIEASLDFLYFIKGRRKIPYNEIELELKEGSEEELAECSSYLRLNYHLSLSGASKYEMGLRSFNLIPLY